MTDEQIIKALEYCKIGECDDCPFYDVKEDCEVELPEEALNVIYRKKAEIEKLKSDNKMYRKANRLIASQRDGRDKEIEALQTQMDWLTGYNKNLLDANTALSGEIEICKSEAIKEFAERLIRTADGDDEYGTVFVFNIEDLVKEMTEVQE